MKLLVAEDTKDLNKAICTMFTMQGYLCDSALDGAGALEMAEQSGYDCFVFDIMMPKMDGITLLSTIRSRGILTPVLLLTAKGEVDDRVNGLEAGADDYLTKPFAMKELLARVQALTRRAGQYGAQALEYSDLVLRPETLELAAENTVRLSMKEFELMQLLMLGRGERAAASRILEHVWKEESAGRETLLLYINYLKQKLFSVDSAVRIDGDPETGYCLKEKE